MPEALSQTNLPAADAKLAPPRDLLPLPFWQAHRWEIAGGIVIILLGLAALICFRRRARPVVVVPPAAQARRDLEALRKHAPDAVLPVRISRVISRYVVSRFNLPPGELTTGELRRALRQAGVNPESTEVIGDFLQRCDEIKFAPGATPADGALIDAALQLVDRLETGGAQ
jgi:hypothetical protein